MNIKKFIQLASILLLCTNAQAGYELVCKGQQQRSQNKAIVIDCSDRQAVVESLKRGWMTLRSQGIGGSTEDLCWKPYNSAKDIHPSINMSSIAPTFFLQCNMALQYLK